MTLAFNDLVRYRVIQVWLVIVAITFFSPQTTSSRALMPTFEMLTRNATLIVVAQVENVIQNGNVSIATARVLDVWKGQSTKSVQFRASRSWTCDASNAIPGEIVVLFLAADAHTGVTAIAYSGMGRLPINNVEGTPTVMLYSSLFTKAMKQETRVPQETFSGNVTLALLKRHVQQVTAVIEEERGNE